MSVSGGPGDRDDRAAEGQETTPSAAWVTPGGGTGAPPGRAKRNEPLAVVALVLAIVGLVICPIIPAVAALIIAARANRYIGTGDPERTGTGLVLASRIIAAIAIPFWVVVFIIAGVTGGNTTKNEHAAVEKPAATAKKRTTTTPPPTTTKVTSPRTTTTQPGPTTTTIPGPAVYDGTGDDVLAIAKPSAGPVIVHAAYTDGSNFVVAALDDNNQQTDLLVNAIGAYDGTLPLDFRTTNTTRLQVTASGPWHIEVRDPRSAQRFDGSVQGHGDNVLIYTGKSGIAAISHTGQSNFVVDEFTSNGDNLLVNEIGPYSGRVPWSKGLSFIEIKADGDWSIGVS